MTTRSALAACIGGLVAATGCSGNVKMGDLGADANVPVLGDETDPGTGGASGTGGVAGTSGAAGTGGASGPEAEAGPSINLWVPPGTDPYAFRKLKYDERPEMAADNYWGGWTDGTVQYVYDATNPPIPPNIVESMWAGESLITTVDIGNELAAAKAVMGSADLSAGLHPKGTGWTQAGGSFSYDANGMGEDLSMYYGGGVVFLAKLGDPNVSKLLALGLNGPAYSPWVPPGQTRPLDGGHCGDPGQGGCYDAPSVYVELATQWRMYVVPFAVFHQQGYGQPVPNVPSTYAMDPDSGRGALVSFLLPKAERFDFWIAGFGFYNAVNAPF